MKTPNKLVVLAILAIVIAVLATGCIRKVDGNEDQNAGIEGTGDLDSGNVTGVTDGITNNAITGNVIKETEQPKTEDSNQQIFQGGRITVQEGKLIQLKATGTDPDGDKVTYKFSAPLDENGKWQTKVGDKGEYSTQVSASDGKSTTVKTFEIIVKEENKAPVLERIGSIRLSAGDTVVLSPKASDSNGDELNITYSGWMTSPAYTTSEQDIGNHKVTVTVTDGELTASEVVNIDVIPRNHAPVMEKIGDITVREGDTITFDPKVTDADGDQITVAYSGWMNSPSYTASYNDAGEYAVKIIASDGKMEASQTVKITVKDSNRPVQLDVSFEIS